MSGVDAGSALAQQIQVAVQPKLMENGWVAEETDTTLAEYVTMMIVNGKDMHGVQSELGSDLLGLGEDDQAVGEFAQWLFDQVRSLSQPQQQGNGANQQEQQPQPIPTVQDAAMEDSPASADAPPTGPKSMRNGNIPQRGRGGRMLGQMNRSMDRSTDLPDNLRRIKGAAGGQSGRINSHSTRDGPPRGPKSQQNIANGVQRMMNGGRGGHHNNNMAGMNPMMQGMNTNMNSQQQMQFMQMMEMQANLLTQMMNNQNGGGQFQNGHAGRGGRGGHRGGRGGHMQDSKLKAVNGKLPDAALPAGPGGSHGNDGMEVDTEDKGSKFSTACRWDLACGFADCAFAHHGPATNGKTSLDMEATCSHGVACTNHSCVARHPSPAKKNSHYSQQDCKFYPNCTNLQCPFRHPSAPPCRNGADCKTPGCTFTHSKIMCRYNPCMKPHCPYKHAEGQKRGNYEDKVWTADGGKAERFAGLESQTENGEELILPGQSNGNAESQQENNQMETTEIVT